jgi:hypothetical protein
VPAYYVTDGSMDALATVRVLCESGVLQNASAVVGPFTSSEAMLAAALVRALRAARIHIHTHIYTDTSLKADAHAQKITRTLTQHTHACL